MSDAPLPSAEPDEHDAWLRQALRHAPDATAAPPNALREAILAEARSAVRVHRPAQRPSLFDHVAAFWAWLALPPVAAGFASVMAAALIGLMWWDRPMDEGLVPPLPARANKPEMAPQPSAAPLADALSTPKPTAAPPPSTQAPMPAAVEAPSAQNAVAAKRALAAPAAAPPARGAEDKQRKERAPVGAMQSAPPASPFPIDAPTERAAARRERAAAPRPGEKAESADGQSARSSLKAAIAGSTSAARPNEAERRAEPTLLDAKKDGGAVAGALAKTASPGAPAPALALRQRAANAPRDAADALVAHPPAAPQAFAAAPVPAPVRESAANGARATSASTAPATMAAPPTPAADYRGTVAGTSIRPMAALLASLARDMSRWTRASSGSAAPLDATTRAWLTEVEASTAGRWQAASDRATRLDDAADGDAGTLMLNRDGRVAAVVRIEAGGVRFEPRPGPAWFAPLGADAVARLRATLPPPNGR